MKKSKLVSLFKLKSSVSQQIYDRTKVLLHYLYMEETCMPFIVKNNKGGIRIRYKNAEKSLIIDVTEDSYIVNNRTYMFSDLYIVVNETKLFYHSCTDKLCLFTGAFNPPTMGHYHMIESAMGAYPFDYVVFAVSNQKFLDKKQKKKNDWSYNEVQRLMLLTAMTCQMPNVLIFGVEQGYTYDVLCAVKKKYNPTDLFFALGSDKLQEIGRWGHHDKLLSEFCFYVLNRGEDLTEVMEKSQVLFRKTKFIVHNDNEEYKDISATEVRKLIKDNGDYKHLVHPEVFVLLSSLQNKDRKDKI